MENFEVLFKKYMLNLCSANPDSSHDILHVQRVVSLAKKLACEEEADLNVVVPAAYLHDCVYICKTDNRRKFASKISADKAVELLREWKYPEQFMEDIHHAILAHSFSAQIKANSIEAQVVQDADRLDAMGAIGIFRCFAFAGISRRPFYSELDPFGQKRDFDDSQNTLDHFYTKLLKLHSLLNTESAKKEGIKRQQTMNNYLEQLKFELDQA